MVCASVPVRQPAISTSIPPADRRLRRRSIRQAQSVHASIDRDPSAIAASRNSWPRAYPSSWPRAWSASHQEIDGHERTLAVPAHVGNECKLNDVYTFGWNDAFTAKENNDKFKSLAHRLTQMSLQIMKQMSSQPY